MKTLIKYAITIRYLKIRQILFQIIYRIGLRLKSKNLNNRSVAKIHLRSLPELVRSDPKINGYSLTLDDILKNKVFESAPKLLLYQNFYLNSFCSRSFELIHSTDYDFKKVAYEPYPSSLRLVNAIYAMLQDPHLVTNSYLENLRKDYTNIAKCIEYHLDGNHLLENYIALCAYELIYNEEYYFKKLMKEIETQFPTDYFHFERSPMYQSILIERFILLSGIMKATKHRAYKDMKIFIEKALNSLNSFKNLDGEFYHFNDSNSDGCLQLEQLQLNFERIFEVSPSLDTLQDVCGFYKVSNDLSSELVIDGGEILAWYIPGHTHDSVGTFSLVVNGNPFIMNNQVSTYESNEQRYLERSAEFHNTIVLSMPLNDVWGSFRVAGRASVCSKQILDTVQVHAARGNSSFTRKVVFERGAVLIEDEVVDCAREFLGTLYFHESVSAAEISGRLKGDTIYCIEDYDRPVGFNKFMPAKRVTYRYKKSLHRLEIQL